jgi:hypothetical protein
MKKPRLYELIWRNKLIDGGDTIDTLIDALLHAADQLKEMSLAGVTLLHSNNDYYLLQTNQKDVANKFGFSEVSQTS